MVSTHRVILSRPFFIFVVLASTGCFEQFILAQNVAVSSNKQSPDQAASLIAAGIQAFERDDLSAARDSFQKALALNRYNVEAHTYLGLMADRAGELKEAEDHFLAAARSAPSLPSARNNYGAILLRMGRLNLAAVQFEASLKLDHNQPNALVNLAQIRFLTGTPQDLRSAAELFARAYAIKPDVEIARALTLVSLRRRDYAATPGFYQQYAERLKQERATSAHSVQARADLGTALLEGGLLAEAETELSAAISLDPANVETVILLARVYLAGKNLPSAGRTLEAAVSRGLDAAPIYALLAEIYEQSGHLENAIPALRLAIQRDPQSEKYRFAYGVLLTNAYAPAAAVMRLEEAIKSFPESPRLWFALGLAYFKHDKNEEANRSFKRAIELDNKFAPAFAYLGLLQAKVGVYNEAVAYYEKALQVDPKLAVVHYLLADSLLKQVDANPQRIESYLRRAAELDGTFTAARLSLGKLFMRLKRWTEAVAELEKATKLDPNVAEAYYHLGRAYGRLNRPAEAQATLKKFKELSDTVKAREDSELREIVRRLGKVVF
jgi:Tfp pilus assembly protein PilF